MKKLLLSTNPNQQKLQTIPIKKKTIKLSRIKISKEMIAAMPRTGKIAKKYEYFKNKTRVNKKYGKNNKPFKSTIILDKHNTLIDGYTSYLIAKMFGIKKVEVVIR